MNHEDILEEIDRIIKFEETLSDEFKSLFISVNLVDPGLRRSTFFMRESVFEDIVMPEEWESDMDTRGDGKEILRVFRKGHPIYCLRDTDKIKILLNENDRLKQRIEELES